MSNGANANDELIYARSGLGSSASEGHLRSGTSRGWDRHPNEDPEEDISSCSRKGSGATQPSVAMFLSQRQLERSLNQLQLERNEEGDGDALELDGIVSPQSYLKIRQASLTQSRDMDMLELGNMDSSRSSSSESSCEGMQTPTYHSGPNKHSNHSGRREPLYDLRGASTSGHSPPSSWQPQSGERRLPMDGGPPDLPRSTLPVTEIAKHCENLLVFKDLHHEDRLALYANMYEVIFQPGEHITHAGEPGRNFYLILSGSVTENKFMHTSANYKLGRKASGDGDVTPAREGAHVLSPGDSFGQLALMHSLPSTSTITAMDTEVKCLALDCITFRQLLSTAAVARRMAVVKWLSHVPEFKSLQSSDLVQLVDSLESRSFREGETIVQQGVIATARFHIIETGSVSVWLEGSDKEVKTMREGQCFGELTFSSSIPPTATVVARSNVQTLSLDGESFQRLLGVGAMQKILDQKQRDYEFDRKNPIRRLSSQVGKSVATAAKKPIGSIGGLMRRISKVFSKETLHGGKKESAMSESVFSISNLTREKVEFLKELGHGMTAVVYLCRLPTIENKIVVIKMMKKSKLVRLKQVDNVIREKQLLMNFDSNYIVRALGCFQDDFYLYLVMDYLDGGELFSLLVEVNTVPRETAALYTAEVMLAIEYLHGQGLVCRDLKPENVLITHDGHLVLTDMGFCKPVKPGERTFTTCGTADYMAPEVMLFKGYDRMVDLWALGVFVFEMLAGYVPFETHNQQNRYHKTLNAIIKFPPSFDKDAEDLVRKLCVLEPSKRLGYGVNGFQELRAHEFFAGINWSELEVENLADRPPGVVLRKKHGIPASTIARMQPMVFREPVHTSHQRREELNSQFTAW